MTVTPLPPRGEPRRQTHSSTPLTEARQAMEAAQRAIAPASAEETALTLRRLWLHYPQSNLSVKELTLVVEDFIQGLPYPYPILQATFREAIATCKHRPTLAELRVIAEEKMAPLRDDYRQAAKRMAELDRESKPPSDPEEEARKRAEIQRMLAAMRKK